MSPECRNGAQGERGLHGYGHLRTCLSTQQRGRYGDVYFAGGRWIDWFANVDTGPLARHARWIAGVGVQVPSMLPLPGHGLKTGEQVRITGVGGNTA